MVEDFIQSDKTTIDLFYKLNDFIQTSHEPKEFFWLWNKLFEKHRANLINIPKSFKIPKRPCKILLTMTSCKRYDLFHQTVNSMLNHWTDKHKIDKWVCVDDNSSKDDRKLMKSTYPFIEFYLKTPAEKGHRESMNIIWNMIKEHKPTYWIHIEDDFLFHTKRSYIEDSIKLIEKHSDIRQVLFNRAYGETIENLDSRGYLPVEPGFVVHEHKQGQFPYSNCHYWPHYSFRPGVIRADVILKLGNYDSPNTFFEMDYAHRWNNAGYKTAFFDSINCRHIGRLTSERNSTTKNAYDLNGEGQFNRMNVIKVINLKRRPDRREQVTKVLNDASVKEFDIVEAVDGKEITPTIELAKLFEGNDFGSRVGVVGCALSHVNLWKALLADQKTNYYVILEDDITLCDKFKAKFDALKPAFEKESYLLLGYHMFTKNRNILKPVEEGTMEIKPLNYGFYVGGTFGYSINKEGAKILLDYISTNGIKHGIDYVVKICSDLKCKEISPPMIYSEWYETPGQNVDTDIQKNYESVNFHSLNTELISKFDFYKGMDSPGNDMGCNHGQLEIMMRTALNNPLCVGFNTLGFFKLQIEKLVPSPYFGANDGIYIKKQSFDSEITEYVKIDKGVPNKNYCFIHSCTAEAGKTSILDGIIEKIKPYRSVFKNVFILNVGFEISITNYGPEYTIINTCKNPKVYEMHTLNSILDFSCKTPDSNILYLHTKGILHSGNPHTLETVEDWKNMMVYHLLNKNKQCTDLLTRYDMVGCNYTNHQTSGPHFSGNFWWATTTHLKKLDKITDFQDRHLAEW